MRCPKGQSKDKRKIPNLSGCRRSPQLSPRRSYKNWRKIYLQIQIQWKDGTEENHNRYFKTETALLAFLKKWSQENSQYIDGGVVLEYPYRIKKRGVILERVGMKGPYKTLKVIISDKP